MAIANNQAAWILKEKDKSLVIKEGPTPDPAKDEVVIEVAYAAINSTDWKVNKKSTISKSNKTKECHVN